MFPEKWHQFEVVDFIYGLSCKLLRSSALLARALCECLCIPRIHCLQVCVFAKCARHRLMNLCAFLHEMRASKNRLPGLDYEEGINQLHSFNAFFFFTDNLHKPSKFPRNLRKILR